MPKNKKLLVSIIIVTVVLLTMAFTIQQRTATRARNEILHSLAHTNISAHFRMLDRYRWLEQHLTDLINSNDLPTQQELTLIRISLYSLNGELWRLTNSISSFAYSTAVYQITNRVPLFFLPEWSFMRPLTNVDLFSDEDMLESLYCIRLVVQEFIKIHERHTFEHIFTSEVPWTPATLYSTSNIAIKANALIDLLEDLRNNQTRLSDMLRSIWDK